MLNFFAKSYIYENKRLYAVVCLSLLVSNQKILSIIDLNPPGSVTQPIGRLDLTYETTGPLPFPVQPPPPLHQPYPLPTTPVQEVNYISAQWDPDEFAETAPWDVHDPVTQIVLTQPQHFVRLLGTPQSSSNGAWIMRSQYVRGKTRAELRDIFALPVVPQEIVDVEMPASPDPATGKDYALWTGIAGPIRTPGFDWGDGGAVQNRLVVDFNGTNYFPNYRYTSSDTRFHRQPLTDPALSYQPMAGSGNALSVAKYLDQFIPLAYSDLEDVYTDLDYLNYVGFGPCPLQAALNQISPEPYDALSFVGTRNSLLFSDTVFENQIFRQWERQWVRHSFLCPPTRCYYPNFWLKAVGEFDRKQTECSHTGFNYHTWGLVGCFDLEPRQDFVVGFGAAGLFNKLDWYNCRGHASINDVKACFYTSYFPSCFFIDTMLSGGYDWTNARRNIQFYGVNRCAQSKPRGGDFEAHIQTGFNLLQQWLTTPLLRLSYFYNKQRNFQEQCADSLNLNVHSFTAQTLRIHLGVEITRMFNTKCAKFIPQVEIAWAHDAVLGKRTICAGLAQLGNLGTPMSFQGIRSNAESLILGTGLNVLIDYVTLFARYDAEIRDKFTADIIKFGVRAVF